MYYKFYLFLCITSDSAQTCNTIHKKPFQIDIDIDIDIDI